MPVVESSLTLVRLTMPVLVVASRRLFPVFRLKLYLCFIVENVFSQSHT